MSGTFVLSIDLGNAEMFSDADVARALRNTATKVEFGPKSAFGRIYDVNGNRVGAWALTRKEEANGDE